MSEHWESILRHYQVNKRPIKICCAFTADAACACHTLTSLLTSNLVQYGVHPILNSSVLKELVAHVLEEAEKECFVLLGIGSMLDLSKLFDRENHIVIVLDNSRPVHLENLRIEQRDPGWIFLWQSVEMRQEINTFFVEQHKKSIRDRQKRLRRAEKKSGRERRSEVSESEATESEDSSSPSEGVSDDEISPSQQIDWLAGPNAIPPSLEAAYASAQCAAKSISMELLDLSVYLNRSKDQFLWNAATGVTDLFVHQRIDYSTFLLLMSRIREQTSLLISVRKSRDDTQSGSASVAANQLKLHLTDEVQLCLLKYWSLWSSIWHSKRTAALLRLQHVDRGEEHLRELLARCGVSVKVAQQSWMEIPSDERLRALQLTCQELEKLERPEQRKDDDDLDSLRDLGSESFRNSHLTLPFIKHPLVVSVISRSYGYGSQVSTFDVCQLFNALLCCPIELGPQVTSMEQMNKQMTEQMRSSFHRAFGIINADPNSEMFLEAANAAKRLEREVSAATSALMQRGVILSTKDIHYMLLNDPSRRAGAIDSFWPPHRLRHLAEHVVVALTVERGKRFPMRPLIVPCPLPFKDSGQEVYNLVLTHEGSVVEPNKPLPAVEFWQSTVRAVDTHSMMFQDELDPLYCCVKGRETASHINEAMHLKCAQNSRKR